MICAAIFLLHIGAGAQEAGRIEGKIHTKTNEPLTGVTLKLSELNKSTISDSSGHFSFQNVGAGKYTILVSYLDQLLTSRSFSFTAIDVLNLDLEVKQITAAIEDCFIRFMGENDVNAPNVNEKLQ